MLQVLVESRAARERRAAWAGVSVVLHSALIGLGVYLTTRAAPELREPVTVEDLAYVHPPAPDAPAAAPVSPFPAPDIRPSITVPQIVVPAIPTPTTDMFSRAIAELSNSAPGSPIGTPAGTSAPSDGIYTAATVDRIVMPLPGNASPSYPMRLSNAGVEGEVLARFVVDTTGRVEPTSIEILQASHGLFGESVKRWLRENRYSPGLVSGRPVRQLVQQRIGFTLTR
jgi:protein TonB